MTAEATEHNSDEARTTAAIEAAYRAEHETALLYEALAVIEPPAAGRAALETTTRRSAFHGEYISVRSQQELMEHRFRTRRQELEKAPGGALRLLTATHQSRGLSVDEAEQVAKALLAGTSQADRPELAGLGSPFAAAASSFAAFAVGAAIPLWPYLIVGPFALLVSVAGSALTLAGVGALLAPSSGRNLWFSAARMLSIGGAAAAVTYTAGRIFDLRTM